MFAVVPSVFQSPSSAPAIADGPKMLAMEFSDDVFVKAIESSAAT